MSEETTQDSPSDSGLIGALVESEYLPVVGFALGLLVFPWLLIDGLQFVGAVTTEQLALASRR